MRTTAMLTLLAVVPALAPAQGGDEAKKLFEAMEERLTKAKSVSLGFSIEGEVGGKPLAKLKGSLAFAAGDRARLEVEGSAFGVDTKVLVISDGKRMHVTTTLNGKPDRKEVPTPKNLTGALARVLSRAGLFPGLESLQLDRDKERELKPNEMFSLSDLTSRAKEKVGDREARVLTYKAVLYSKQKEALTLWVDPLTNLPLKRKLISGTMEKAYLVELYTDLKTDAKLDPKQFELPK
jgi:outer membrane lipoprotein-sorting protein